MRLARQILGSTVVVLTISCAFALGCRGKQAPALSPAEANKLVIVKAVWGDMADEHMLAAGAVEGVGKSTATVTLQFGGNEPRVSQRPVASQADAVSLCLMELEQRAPESGPTGAQQPPK